MKKDTIPTETAFPSGPQLEGGLTKREYFAAHILSGMVHVMPSVKDLNSLADRAYQAADALIERLNRDSN